MSGNKGFYPGPNGLLIPRQVTRAANGQTLALNTAYSFPSDCASVIVPDGATPGDWITVQRESANSTVMNFVTAFGSDYVSDSIFVTDASSVFEFVWNGQQWWLTACIAPNMVRGQYGKVQILNASYSSAAVGNNWHLPTWDTVLDNSGGFYDAASKNFIATAPGIYEVKFCWQWGSTSSSTPAIVWSTAGQIDDANNTRIVSPNLQYGVQVNTGGTFNVGVAASIKVTQKTWINAGMFLASTVTNNCSNGNCSLTIAGPY